MDNLNIKFSILMPCYNDQQHVRRAIESVINQTYSNWEFIIVNDGSNDDSLKIINEYKNDPRIKIFSKLNGGTCSAMNLGLDNISGNYLLVLGSDDFLFVDLLEKSYKLLQDNNPDVAAFISYVHINGTKNIDNSTNFQNTIIEKNITLKQYNDKYPNIYTDIFHWRDTSKFYKISLLKKLRYFGKYGSNADCIFSLLFSHRCKSFMILPIDGYNIVIRKDSTSHKKISLLGIVDSINIFRDFLNYINEDCDISGCVIDDDIKNIYEFQQYVAELRKNGLNIFFKNYKLIKTVSKLCCRTIKKYQLSKCIPFKNKITAKYPLLWILYH